MSAPVRPGFTPAPVQRIEPSVSTRSFTVPAQSQPSRSPTPAFRSSPAAVQAVPRVAQPAPSVRSAPAPAPAQPAAPVQRSAPGPSGGRSGGNAGQTSRPGR
jgi:hypothetical protein